MAQFWFEETADIAPNQMLNVPDSNVTVARELNMLKVEVVVRAYLTGSSDTSIWTHYNRGVRVYCGFRLPDGMKKNQPLPQTILTPTTKSEGHDEPISPLQVITYGLVPRAVWEQVEAIALALFARGTEIAARQGLILVDSKYEMGLDEEGRVTLADEVHTPDSSRYWIAATYQERFAAGQEPESLDKEFLRLWLREHGASDKRIPKLDDDIRIETALHYVDLYERVTGLPFVPERHNQPARRRIQAILKKEFASC